jgi:glycosyltransferase involved in cell wall biosynthesis
MPLTILSVAYPLAPVTRATSGGAEQIVALLDDTFVRAGHRSLVVACEGSQVRGELIATPRHHGAIDNRAQREAHARHLATIRRVIDRVDVVHYHGLDFLWYDVDADVPKIVTLHLPPEWYPPAIFTRDDLTLVAVSQSECARAPRCDAVVPNGIDIHAFEPRATPGGDYALIVGRICPEKNVHEAIDAARAASIRVVIAGEVFPFVEHDAYFRDAIAPRLGDDVVFIGAVAMPEKRDLFAGARCVLIPSKAAETSSLVAMEALACGTPVIAFDSGALREVVGRGGVIVRNQQEMTDAIRAIGALDRTLCRAEAEERFDAGAMAARYLNLYSAEIRSPRSPVWANNIRP